MRNLLLATLFLLFAATGCAFKPTSKYDTFTERAQLPQEEAPHRQNSLEWWYFTGHLRDRATGETFGVEYVFFHFSPTGKKDWQMVNFAITDPQQQKFHYDYKVQRLPQPLAPTLPLALATDKQAERWTLRGQEGRYTLQARMTTQAGQAISLTTRPARPVLLHSGTGFEQYGTLAKAGYYSYPRLAATGSIEVDGKTREVEGELWYDRQWNCLDVLSKGDGWDWFSIQLQEPLKVEASAGRSAYIVSAPTEIMAYQLRDKATDKPIRGGTLSKVTLPEALHLSAQDFQLETLAYWTSPRTHLRYPSKWRLRIPSQGYDLTITPVLPDQELSLKLFAGIKMHYWEGMCRVEGTYQGQPVQGNSYVEITNRKESRRVREAVEAVE